MSDPIFFAPLRVPVINERTGLMAREWYLFFQAMFIRVGGSSGTTILINPDLLQSPAAPGVAELFALQASAADAAAQAPPPIPNIALDDQSPVVIPGITFDDLLGELRQTRDQVAELTKRFQDMQQGTVTI